MASELIAAVVALLAVALHPLVAEPPPVVDGLAVCALVLALLPLSSVAGAWIHGLLSPKLSFTRWRAWVILYRQHSVLFFLGIVYGFDWPLAIEELVGEGHWWTGFLALAPYLVLRGQQWVFEAPLMRFIGDPRPARRLIMERARILLLLLIPLALYDAVLEAIADNETWRPWLESIGAVWWAINALIVFVMIAIMPFLVRWAIGAVTLPSSPLRDLLVAFGRRLDIRFRDFLLWDTGGRMPNAAVIGFWARTRYVMFTDALLARLNPTELLAVLGHEAGHVARRHVLRYLFITMTFLLGADVALELSGTAEWFEVQWGEAGIGGVWLLVFLVYWRFVFGWFSRRFEQEADVYGARHVGDPEAFAAALDRIAGVGTHARRHRSWRYFSIERRIEFVRKLESDPAEVIRFEQRLQRISRIVAFAGAVVIGLGGWLGWRSFQLDRGALMLQIDEPRRAIRALETVPSEVRRNGLRRDVYLIAAWLETTSSTSTEPGDAGQLRSQARQRLESASHSARSPLERATLERLWAEWERQMGRDRAAADRLEGLSETGFGRPSDERDRAGDLVAAGDRVEAARIYREAIGSIPETSEVLSWLASDSKDGATGR